MQSKLIASILKLEDPKCVLPHPDLKQQELLQKAGTPYISYLDRTLKEQHSYHIQSIKIKRGSQAFSQRIKRNPRVGQLFQIEKIPKPQLTIDADHCMPTFIPPSFPYDFDQFLKEAGKIVWRGKYLEIKSLIEKKLKEKLLRLLYESRYNESLALQHLKENQRLFMDAVMAEMMIYNRRTADTIITQFPRRK